MMKANLQCMASISDEMTSQLRNLNFAMYRVEDVRRAIQGMSGMSEPANTLRSIENKIQDNNQKYRNMETATEQIQACYRLCEKRISDNLEMESIAFVQKWNGE